MNAQMSHAPQSKESAKKSDSHESSISMPSQVLVRAQLKMTNPGDSDEQEANEVADSIVKEGKISRSVSGGHSGGGIALPSSLGSQLASMQGHGSQLPGNIKAQMETGFGRDFSNVRIHTDSSAASMSESISAKAFTYGNDIYFNRGQFDPGTTVGQHLIAHELTHVVQGKSSVRREEENASSLTSAEIRTIKSSLPTDVGLLSDESIALLDKTIKVFNTQIQSFKPFADGVTLRENYYQKQTNIPDISKIIKSCSKYLVTKNGKSRLRSDRSFTIELDNPEVRKYLMASISRDDAAYFYLWMKYAKSSSWNPMSKALGFPPLSKDDYVKHTYWLTYLGEISGSVTVGIGLGAGYSVYQVSYQNNLGMEWSMLISRASGGISFGLGAHMSIANFNVIEDLGTSKPEKSDTWFTPYDFSKSTVSMGADASLHASFVAEVSAGFSFLTVKMPGKGELSFDTSGSAMLTYGAQAGVGASYGMSGGTFLNANSFTTRDTSPYLFHAPDKQYEKEIDSFILASDFLFFETGSDDVYSNTNGEDNRDVLKAIAARMKDAYALCKKENNFEGFEVELTGHASPLWKTGRKSHREEKNLVLSEKRAVAVQKELQSLLSSKIGAYLTFLINSLFHLSPVESSIDAEGDREGMEMTDDITNNDEFYRRVDIIVRLKQKRIRYGITP